MDEATHKGHWSKSSYSGREVNCLEYAPLTSPSEALRDSKHPERGHLTFPAPEWAAFLAAVRVDEV